MVFPNGRDDLLMNELAQAILSAVQNAFQDPEVRAEYERWKKKNMSNKALGTSFEQRLADKLYEHGFWVHLLTQNQAGQPADIIAVKDNRAVLIDAKVCSNGKFDTSRIESNQLGSMKVWRESGNMEWWFALEMPNEEIYFVPGQVAATWEARESQSTIYSRDMDKFLNLEGWFARWDERMWEP